MLGWPLMDPAASLLVSFLIAKEGTASSIPAHARTRARTHARTQTQPRGRAQHTTCKRRTRSGKRRLAGRARAGAGQCARAVRRGADARRARGCQPDCIGGMRRHARTARRAATLQPLRTFPRRSARKGSVRMNLRCAALRLQVDGVEGTRALRGRRMGSYILVGAAHASQPSQPA